MKPEREDVPQTNRTVMRAGPDGGATREGYLTPVVALLGDLFRQRELLWSFVQRNLKVRYKGSTLGMLWFLLSPLLSVFVFWLVFTKIIQLDIAYYPLFMFIGISHWNFFTGSCFGGTNSFPENANLLRKVHFTRAVLPMAAVLTSFVQMLINFAILLPVLLLFLPVSPEHMAILPVLLAISLTFCSGVAFLLATSQVFIRDTFAIMEIIVMLGFYVTPIFYSVEMVPEAVRGLYLLNPVASLTVLYRNALFYDKGPDLFCLAVALVWAVTIFAAGVAVLRRYDNRIVKEV